MPQFHIFIEWHYLSCCVFNISNHMVRRAFCGGPLPISGFPISRSHQGEICWWRNHPIASGRMYNKLIFVATRAANQSMKITKWRKIQRGWISSRSVERYWYCIRHKVPIQRKACAFCLFLISAWRDKIIKTDTQWSIQRLCNWVTN